MVNTLGGGALRRYVLYYNCSFIILFYPCVSTLTVQFVNLGSDKTARSSLGWTSQYTDMKQATSGSFIGNLRLIAISPWPGPLQFRIYKGYVKRNSDVLYTIHHIRVHTWTTHMGLIHSQSGKWNTEWMLSLWASNQIAVEKIWCLLIGCSQQQHSFGAPFATHIY